MSGPAKIACGLVDYNPIADFAGSLDECYRAIRERIAAGGPPWVPQAQVSRISTGGTRGTIGDGNTRGQAATGPEILPAGRTS
jgi:hypothetical protein